MNGKSLSPSEAKIFYRNILKCINDNDFDGVVYHLEYLEQHTDSQTYGPKFIRGFFKYIYELEDQEHHYACFSYLCKGLQLEKKLREREEEDLFVSELEMLSLIHI